VIEDERLRELRDAYRAVRREWEDEPTQTTERKILAIEDAMYGRFVELARIDLERAKGTTTEARAAVDAARQRLRDAQQALATGDGGVDAVLAAQDALEDARRRLLHARVDEDAARATLTEAVVARYGEEVVSAVIGLPISVSVSPGARQELRDALFGEVL
jgi:hypothetical protein